MTENQELQAFDETLREFLKEPDHFLTSLALVNHLQRTPVLAAQDLYAVEVEGKKVVPVFTNEQDLQSFKATQESAREQIWIERSSLDVLTQLVQAELFGLAFNLKEDGDFSNTTLFASSELIQFINYFTQTLIIFWVRKIKRQLLKIRFILFQPSFTNARKMARMTVSLRPCRMQRDRVMCLCLRT